MPDRKHFILWGSAGHAKVLSQLISLHGGLVDAIFDNNPDAEPALKGVACYIGQEGFELWIRDRGERKNIYGLAAIGGSRGQDRIKIQELFRLHGIKIEPLVHPDASVCTTSSLGNGTQVLAQSTVSSGTRTGEACIINHGAIADHECTLGNGVHLAPGSVLCGYVTLGNNVLIGAGAVILPRVSIGENTVVGAGSVVTCNLPRDVVAIGNPARVIRNNG